MGWSRAGALLARELTGTLAAEHAPVIVHSGLRRTKRLAHMIAARTNAPLICDRRWRERDFGSWEGRSWHAIWRETGDLMDRMVTHPADFRPGGGETSVELFQRVGHAWAELPREASVIVIAHGGSIAAARAHHAGWAVERLIDLIPEPGSTSVVAREIAPSSHPPGTARHCTL